VPLLLAFFVVLLAACTPASELEVHVDLATPASDLPDRATLHTRWLGEARTEVLRPSQQGNTVHYQTTLRGAPVQMLPMRFELERNGVSATFYENLEVVRPGEILAYAVDSERPGIVRRVARPGTVAEGEARERTAVGLHLAWAVIAMLGVGLGLRRREPGPDPARWPRWADALVWVGLAVVLSWPALLAGPERFVGRHFDLMGTIWSLDATARLLMTGFQDPLTAFPTGADYRAFDSYTMLPLGAVASWLHPARVHGLLQVAGVAASGWAATAMARGLGARGPWALLAGVGFAGSGIAATVLLEGHVYHLLNPWLPLLAWSWWRATGPEGTVKHGLLAALGFSGALLTTGYLGVAGGVIVAGLFVGGLTRRDLALWRPALAALLGVLPALAIVALGLTGHEAAGDGHLDATVQSAANLVGLSGATPELDRAYHSQAPSPPMTLLALAAMAPLVLKKRRDWRIFGLVGLIGLSLSFGPRLLASALEPLGPSPLAWLWALPGSALLRFPARFAWVWSLCLGAVAALVASQLRPRGLRAALLTAAVAVDLIVITGLPVRQGTLVGGHSTALAEATGPIFELLPEGIDHSGDLDAWLSAMACARQVEHAQAIAEDCVRVPVTSNPRFTLGRTVASALLGGDGPGAARALHLAGFRSLAWQPDLFHDALRTRLAASLAALDTRPTRSTDGGVHVVIYEIPEGAPPAEEPGIAAPGGPHCDDLEVVIRVPRDLGLGERIGIVLRGEEGSTQATAGLHETGPGDWDGDDAWRAHLTPPGAGPYTLSLAGTQAGAPVGLWHGPITLLGPTDRIDLAVFDGPNGVHALPAALASEGHAHGLRSGEGRVALLGWIAWLVALLGVFALRSRSRRAQSSR